MSSREDQAAAKIQAMHRGSQARREVDDKRKREAARSDPTRVEPRPEKLQGH